MAEAEIVERNESLPATLEELIDFVIVGNEAVKAWKNKIRAIDKASVASEAHKQSLQDGQKMGELVLLAEAKLGELLIPLKQNIESSGRGKLVNKKKLPKGISHKESHYAQEIYRFPNLLHETVVEAIDKNDIPTRHEVLKKIRKKKHEVKIEKQKIEIKEGLEKPKGLFDIIVIDPPWKYDKSEYDPDTRRVASPYPEMSLDEIKNIELPNKDDCILWLWTTQKLIWDAKQIMDYWDFEYIAILTWDKEKMGMGRWFRIQCEFCLLGIKGKPLWESKDIRDIIREPRREHSVKPDCFYKMIDDKFVGRKLDYFGRTKREGWDIYGAGQNSISE